MTDAEFRAEVLVLLKRIETAGSFRPGGLCPFCYRSVKGGEEKHAHGCTFTLLIDRCLLCDKCGKPNRVCASPPGTVHVFLPAKCGCAS